MEEMRGGGIGGDIISEERLRAVEKLTEQLQKMGGRSEIRHKQEGAVLNKTLVDVITKLLSHYNWLQV